MNSWKWRILYKYQTGGLFWFLINCFLWMMAFQNYAFAGRSVWPLIFWSMMFVIQSVLIYMLHTNASYKLYKRLQGLELHKGDKDLIECIERYKVRLARLNRADRLKELDTMAEVDPDFKKHPELYGLLKRTLDLL